jgi:hypothetical protein
VGWVNPAQELNAANGFYSAGLFSPVRISEGVEVAQPIALLFGLLFFRKYPAARRTNEERAAGLQEWKTHGDYLD